MTAITTRPSGVLGEFIFDNVSFEYEEKDKVLHNISFSVKAGQKIALLGSTGSGKTSLGKPASAFL